MTDLVDIFVLSLKPSECQKSVIGIEQQSSVPSKAYYIKYTSGEDRGYTLMYFYYDVKGQLY